MLLESSTQLSQGLQKRLPTAPAECSSTASVTHFQHHVFWLHKSNKSAQKIIFSLQAKRQTGPKESEKIHVHYIILTKMWAELLMPSRVKIKRNGLAAKQTLKHRTKLISGGQRGRKMEEKNKERQIKDTIRKTERKYNPRWRRKIP